MKTNFTVNNSALVLKGDDDGLDIRITFDGQTVYEWSVPPGYVWTGHIGGSGILVKDEEDGATPEENPPDGAETPPEA